MIEAIMPLINAAMPVINGAIGGLISSSVGFLSKDGKKFSLKKFLPRVIIGALVGGYCVYAGIGMEQGMAIMSSGFVVYIIEKGVQILIKKFPKKVKAIEKTVKEWFKHAGKGRN